MKLLFERFPIEQTASDITTKDYSSYVKLPESKKTPIRIIFSKEEIEALFSVCPSMPYVDTTLVMTLPDVHLSELLNIKLSDTLTRIGTSLLRIVKQLLARIDRFQ